MTRKSALSSDKRTHALSRSLSQQTKKQRNLVGVLWLINLEDTREDPITLLDKRERMKVRGILDCTYSSLSVCVLIFPVFGQSTEQANKSM